MPNRYLITAVQMVSPRGETSLTIRAGIAESVELIAAQAVAAFYLEHPGLGFMPVAAVSCEVGLEALEQAVAILKGEAPVNTAILTRRRGRRPKLAPGMIPAKQESLSPQAEAVLQDYLKSRESAWGKLNSEQTEPEPEPEP